MQINILFSMRVKFYINISQSLIHNPKLVEIIKPLNHLLQAKIEHFNKYLQAAL